MTSFTKYLAAAAAVGALAAPAAAQYYAQPSYQQQYQQQYPQYQQQYPQYQQQYPQQAYPGTAYGQQGYTQSYNQNPIQSIIDSLLGNRYNVTDRQAVSRCASAALTQAQAQYAGGNGAYGNRYGQQYGQGYNRASTLRVTSISEVQRRNNGLRVTGMISSGAGYNGQHGYQDQRDSDDGDRNQGYANRGYAARGDMSFRCNVDYRGAVTGLRVRPVDAYRG